MRKGARGAMTRVAAGALVGASLAVAACGGEAGPRDLKFGHVGEPGSLFARSAEEFARRANARLPEGWEVVVYGSSQLGGDELLLQKIKLGTVDFALPSSVMSSQIDEFGLFEMPYLVADREHMKRIETELFWSDLAPLAEARGYPILAVWENGFRHVTNNVRPIRGPDDLAGVKLRTPRGVWRVKLFQALGANPTPMALSEVFIGLQTGVIDGQENPLAQIWGSKLYEVQDYLSLTGHVYTPGYVVVSPRGWSGYPPEVRAVLEEEAKATQAFVYETAAELDRRLVEAVRDEGVAVNEVDPAVFTGRSEAVYADFAGSVPGGAGLVERAAAVRDPRP
ncbi:MAG: TRAP transporter substrate-binding protein [Gemmatimonadota bacterium]|nr:TRAP transporter substrate-binding protein [Gemmatimonadota bacterium]MDH5758437.1 TRAP transporter substrate-binding protein [Gemmatimonadota bacterium]